MFQELKFEWVWEGQGTVSSREEDERWRFSGLIRSGWWPRKWW